MSSPDKKPLMLWACLPLLVLIIALLVALHQQRQKLQTLKAQTEETDRAIASLRKQIAQAKAATTPAPAKNAAAPEKKPPQARGPLSFVDRDAMNDPRFAAIVTRHLRRGTLANYKGTLAALQLSPEIEARLKVIITEWWNADEDANDVLARSGQNPEGLRDKLSEEIQMEFKQNLSQVLGVEGARQFEYLSKLERQQSFNVGLYTELWDAGFPLNEAQQNALTRAQVEIGARFETAKAASEDSAANSRETEYQELLQAAASFLSPEQLGFIETQQREAARRRDLSASSGRRPTP